MVARRRTGISRGLGYVKTVGIVAGAETVCARTAASFDELGLSPELTAALTAHGLTIPFPIQAATLPSSLAGRDVLGRGRTGSGKTMAFGGRQAAALREGAEVVVATPGRLRDLVGRGDCRLGQVQVAVLDEADQMADMGFLPQVTALSTLVCPDGQRVRAVDRLMAAAGVTAVRTTVHSSGGELARITGARAPSGVPVVVAAPVSAVCPGRGSARGSKHRRHSAGKAPQFRSGPTAPATSASRRRNAT